MTALHGILHLEVTESMPDLLNGTIGEAKKLGVRLTSNLPVGVTILGTPDEIHAWLDRIRALLDIRAAENRAHDWRTEDYAQHRKAVLDAHGVDIGPIDDPQHVATAVQIRPFLESWVPQMSDAELAARFEDWTTDGRHDLFAAHLNTLYEPGPTEADLVHAEQDEALGSVFGVDD